MSSQAFWHLLTLMEAAIIGIGMYQMGQVSELSLKISVVGVFVHFLVVLIYESFGQSQDETERERRLNILGNIRFLTAAAATIIMLLIIVPPIGWAFLPLAIILVLKIAFNLMHRNNTSDPIPVAWNNMEDGREQQQLSLPPSTHDSGGVMHQSNTSDPIPVASNNMEDGTEEQQLSSPPSTHDFAGDMHQNNTSDPSSVAPDNTEERAEEQQLPPSTELVVTIEDKQESD